MFTRLAESNRSFLSHHKERRGPPEALRTSPLLPSTYLDPALALGFASAANPAGSPARFKLLRFVSESYVMTQIAGLERHRNLRVHRVLRLVVDDVGGHHIGPAAIRRIFDDGVLAGD